MLPFLKIIVMINVKEQMLLQQLLSCQGVLYAILEDLPEETVVKVLVEAEIKAIDSLLNRIKK